MKILVIGNEKEKNIELGCQAAAACNAEIAYLPLRKNEYGCVDCQTCRLNDGHCAWKDTLAETVDQLLSADTLVFSSPVDFFNMSAQLKPFVG